LIELVRGGLVIVRRETVVEEDSADEVTKVWITEAGKQVLVTQP